MSADLTLIRRYLNGLSSSRQTTDQRRFAYIATVSALYASYETFAEQLAFRFGQVMLEDPRGLTHEQLENLRSKYVSNASVLLGKNLGVGRYKEITELDIAKSLASCLDDSNPYSIRLEVISLHATNLRWDALFDLFRWAAPDLVTKIRAADAIRQWRQNTNHDDGDTPAELIARELEDLVERRNEVAHRAIPDEIISPEQLLEKVDFIDSMCLSLVACLSSLVLRASEERNESEALGVPSKYFHQGLVVVISNLGAPVKVGDVVWAANARVARWGRVLEIQLDNEPVGQVDAGIEAGLRLDFVPPRGGSLYAWRSPDPDLVDPPRAMFGANESASNSSTAGEKNQPSE